jgi:hypothetical protein
MASVKERNLVDFSPAFVLEYLNILSGGQVPHADESSETSTCKVFVLGVDRNIYDLVSMTPECPK